MTLEHIFQRDARSLIRNGNFSQGTAFWNGNKLKHVALDLQALSAEGTGFSYGLEIAANSASVYSVSGAWQHVDETLFSFPTTLAGGNVQFLPLTRNKAVLRLVKGVSTYNGQLLKDVVADPLETPVASFPAALLFQCPFRIVEQSIQDSESVFKLVYPNIGATVTLSDVFIKTRSGVYAANDAVSVLDGNSITQSTDLSKFEDVALKISVTGDNEFTAILDSDSPFVDSVELLDLDPGAGIYQITIYGNAADLLATPRGTIPEQYGIKDGDVFSDNKSGALEITQVVSMSDRVVLVAKLIKVGIGTGLSTKNIADAITDLTSWSVFAGSYANVLVDMPLYQYDLGVSFTYRTAGYTIPNDPYISFVLEEFGGEIESSSFVLYANTLNSRTVELDASFSRRLVEFSGLSTTPKQGRATLVFPGPVDAITLPVSKLGPRLVVDLGAGGAAAQKLEMTVTVPVGSVPGETPSSLLNIPITLASIVTLSGSSSWVNSLVGIPITFTEYISTAVTVEPDMIDITLRAPWPATVQFPFVDDFTQLGIVQASAALSVTQPCLIGDVALFKGGAYSFAKSIAMDGLVDPSEQNAKFDLLTTRIDPLEVAIPKGTVVLFSDGACPAGFKRVNSYAEAEVEGLLSIPFPDSVLINQDRSLLVWNKASYPIVDANGAVAVIEATETTITSTSPSGAPISSKVFSAQQQLQPGMFIRVPEVDYSSALNKSLWGATESTDREFLVLDVRPGIPEESETELPSALPYAATGKQSGSTVYPKVIDTNLIEPPFRDSIPFAAPLTEQKETFSGNKPFLAGINSLEQLETNNGQLLRIKARVYANSPVVNKYTVTNLANPAVTFTVGDVVWVEYRTRVPWFSVAASPGITGVANKYGNNGFKTEFAARIVSVATGIQSGTQPAVTIDTELVLERYDGNPIYTGGLNLSDPAVLKLLAGSGQFTSMSNPLSLTEGTDVFIRPILLLGSDTQLNINGVITPKDISAAKIIGPAGNTQWSLVSLASGAALSVIVQGKFPLAELDAGAGIRVEPTGYLINQVDNGTLVYGAGAHSHEVVAAEQYVQGSVPAWFLEQDTNGNPKVPIISAASNHSHGALRHYTYNLPAFCLLVPCIKL